MKRRRSPCPARRKGYIAACQSAPILSPINLVGGFNPSEKYYSVGNIPAIVNRDHDDILVYH